MAEEVEDKSEPLWERMAEVKPPRGEAVLAEGEIPSGSGSSLSKRMQQSPKMSDMQIADKRLFPVLKETVAWLSYLMVARVSPETYLPLRNIVVKHLLKDFSDLQMAEAVVIAETAISIAIDGEGRIDELALFGRSGEAEEEEKKKIL